MLKRRIPIKDQKRVVTWVWFGSCTVDEAAELMQVTAARVNAWKDKYWKEIGCSVPLAEIERQQKTGRDEYLVAAKKEARKKWPMLPKDARLVAKKVVMSKEGTKGTI